MTAGVSATPHERCRVRFVQARQGPLHQPPRRGPHVGAGAAPGRRAGRLHRGLLAPPRSCTSAWPCPPGTSRWPSTSTSASDDRARGRRRSSSCPPRSHPALPAGIEVQRPSCCRPGPTSLQQAVTTCTWHIEVADIAPPAATAAVGPGAGRHRTRGDPRAQGPHRHRRRPPGHPLPAGDRPRHRGRGPARARRSALGTALEAELATQPRALRPAELVDAIDPSWVVARVTRIHQWTQAGGARREVVDLAPAATPPPHAEVRAS